MILSDLVKPIPGRGEELIYGYAHMAFTLLFANKNIAEK